MNYHILRNKNELDSTGYIEIVPGKYSGKHWQDGSLYIWEDAFGMAEGILMKHLPDYDHFSMNDIPKIIGHKVIKEWRRVAEHMDMMNIGQIQRALNIEAVFHEDLEDEIVIHRTDIAGMLTELANTCDEFYEQQDWVCILGV